MTPPTFQERRQGLKLQAASPPPLLCLGAISGTSMDAVDVAALRTDGATVHERLGAAEYPLSARLRAALEPVAADPAQGRRPQPALAALVADEFAAAIEDFRAARPGLGAPDLVGCHGQTVLHAPAEGLSVQLCDWQRLADRLGAPVAGDFRAADLAAGGQGAPLAPLYHMMIAAERAAPADYPLAVLNIGGVANLTYIPAPAAPERLLAFDTGPGNALLDDCARALLGAPRDEDGRCARGGRPDPAALARCEADPFLAAPPPKAADRNQFRGWLAAVEGLAAPDALATLAAGTASGLRRGLALLPAPPRRLFLAGGGRRNAYLAGLLRAAAPASAVEDVEALGVGGDAVEAELFAVLAARSSLGLPCTYPGTTGVARPCGAGRLWRPRRQGPPG